MDERARTVASKFLSWALRHEPGAVGLTLDTHGWVAVDELLTAAATHGRALTRAQLDEIVATSPKQRFAFSADGTRIRASQGHSVDVELGYAPAEPPETLFHGTVDAALDAIRADGLRKMSRHHVHLSADEPTARAVGSRRGWPILLRVAAGRMHRDGHAFFRSANGVWLTDHVPPDYLDGTSVAPSSPRRSSMSEKDKPGTERHRDQQRADHGPVYHGEKDWDQADEEAPREALREEAEREAMSNIEDADERIADPGTRGAAFGAGGKGQVMRDQDNPDAKRAKVHPHEDGKKP